MLGARTPVSRSHLIPWPRSILRGGLAVVMVVAGLLALAICIPLAAARGGGGGLPDMILPGLAMPQALQGHDDEVPPPRVPLTVHLVNLR